MDAYLAMLIIWPYQNNRTYDSLKIVIFRNAYRWCETMCISDTYSRRGAEDDPPPRSPQLKHKPMGDA